MDTGEKGKKVYSKLLWMPACVLQHRAATGTDEKNPNPKQKFAWESDSEHFIFIYMTDLGKELELKGKGGEK